METRSGGAKERLGAKLEKQKTIMLKLRYQKGNVRYRICIDSAFA